MQNLAKLFYDWEIQLLVLLSFTIQLFLFFTGGLRQCTTNIFLRLSIWIAYLGADTVAVYALGYLTRHEDAHPLAFFWAPFLLIHLGGQDTITAFSMEDNNLWLRHLLNLVVQCVLAIYVFWESIGRHDVQLLIPGILVFTTGIIKYGERIWSLRCGSFEVLEGLSGGNQYEYRLPEVAPEPKGDANVNIGYDVIVCMGLRSMTSVFNIFVARFAPLPSIHQHILEVQGMKPVVKLLEIELGVMYNDLYTKALVLRTRRCMVLRCISHASAVVAFIMFFACHRGRYSRADVAITNLLFTGGLFLEICGAISHMGSPWTWAWLKARKYDKLARLSWFLFSIDLAGWPEKRPLWSNVMGQYNLRGWLESGEKHRPSSSFNQQSMTMVRKLATFVGVEKKRIFWMSKLLDREYVKVDRLLECLLEGVHRFRFHPCRELLTFGPTFIRYILAEYNFGLTIARFHLITELYLSRYLCSDVEETEAAAETDDNVLMEECRKLSRYMMYLLVTSPALLPLGESVVATLEEWQEKKHLSRWRDGLEQLVPKKAKETLEEIKELWIRLIIYAASKSRPAVHAAQLARGGELLTFVWLLLGHYRFQPTGHRIHLTRPQGTRHRYEFYVLDIPSQDLDYSSTI